MATKNWGIFAKIFSNCVENKVCYGEIADTACSFIVAWVFYWVRDEGIAMNVS